MIVGSVLIVAVSKSMASSAASASTKDEDLALKAMDLDGTEDLIENT